jgi:hypothetical protein
LGLKLLARAKGCLKVVSNGLKKNRAMARLYFKGSKVQGGLRWFEESRHGTIVLQGFKSSRWFEVV